MKKILLIPILILFLFNSSFAQSKRSTIRFQLSDGGLIQIAINGRYFNKTGRSLTIGDIPGKWQEIKIYRFQPYANRPGGKASLLFSGDIKIQKGSKYEAIIDAKTNQLYLTQVNNLNVNNGKLPPPQNNQILKNGNLPDQQKIVDTSNQDDAPETNTAATLSSDMQGLQKQMNAEVSDQKKLDKALTFLHDIESLSSNDAKNICSWLLFDDNRMKFLKAAYDKISDPQHLEIVKQTFTETSTKESFESYLQSK